MASPSGRVFTQVTTLELVAFTAMWYPKADYLSPYGMNDSSSTATYLAEKLQASGTDPWALMSYLTDDSWRRWVLGKEEELPRQEELVSLREWQDDFVSRHGIYITSLPSDMNFNLDIRASTPGSNHQPKAIRRISKYRAAQYFIPHERLLAIVDSFAAATYFHSIKDLAIVTDLLSEARTDLIVVSEERDTDYPGDLTMQARLLTSEASTILSRQPDRLVTHMKRPSESSRDGQRLTQRARITDRLVSAIPKTSSAPLRNIARLEVAYYLATTSLDSMVVAAQGSESEKVEIALRDSLERTNGAADICHQLTIGQNSLSEPSPGR